MRANSEKFCAVARYAVGSGRSRLGHNHTPAARMGRGWPGSGGGWRLLRRSGSSGGSSGGRSGRLGAMLAATWDNAGGDLGQCWRPAFWWPLGAAPAAGLVAAPAVGVCFRSGRGPATLAATWGGFGSFGGQLGAARGQLWRRLGQFGQFRRSGLAAAALAEFARKPPESCPGLIGFNPDLLDSTRVGSNKPGLNPISPGWLAVGVR